MIKKFNFKRNKELDKYDEKRTSKIYNNIKMRTDK